MPSVWPKNVMALHKPYVRQIGPFLFPCMLITGYLMAKATMIGYKDLKKKEALGQSGHH